MKTTLLKELPILGIVLVPLAYLILVWNSLPPSIPMHFDIEGHIDRYGDKNELALITFILPVVIYVILLLVPKFDPKGKIERMGNKFQQLKLVIVLFMSSLAVYFIYIASRGGDAPPNGPMALIALFMALMGNFFQSIRPNYFIGIRTPWTLENEEVWKATHRFAGKIWLVGGILLAILSFLLVPKLFIPAFITMVILFGVVPFVYSFVKYRELKKQQQ